MDRKRNYDEAVAVDKHEEELAVNEEAPAFDVTDEVYGMLWTHKIMPFVGQGSYLFVAGVCRKMKSYYEAFFASLVASEIAGITRPFENYQHKTIDSKNADVYCTFYSIAFSSLNCAKMWHKNKGVYPHTDNIRTYYDEQDFKYGELAAAAGNLDVLRWMKQNKIQPLEAKDVIAGAFNGGGVKVLQWADLHGLLDPKKGYHQDGYWLVGRRTSLEVIQWLEKIGFKSPRSWYCHAAQHGHLDIIQHLLDQTALDRRWEPPSRRAVLEYAAKGGHLDVMNYVQDSNRFPRAAAANDRYDLGRLYRAPAKNNRLDIIQWLHSKLKLPFDDQVVTKASKVGNLEMVKFLVNNGAPFYPLDLWYGSEFAINIAAREGHFEVVKFLASVGAESTSKTVQLAANEGHVEIVQWLFENKRPQQQFEIKLPPIVKSGLVHVLQFFLQDFEFHRQVASNSIEDEFRGDDVLEVAVDAEKKEIVELILSAAKFDGHFTGNHVHYMISDAFEKNKTMEVLNWLLQHKQAHDYFDRDYLDFADPSAPLRNGNLEALKLVVQHRRRFNSELKDRWGDLTEARGFEGAVYQDTDMYDKSLVSRKIECVKYVLMNGCPLPTQKFFNPNVESACPHKHCIHRQLHEWISSQDWVSTAGNKYMMMHED